ncbi:hypothetical protein [Mesorhizobium sp. M2A.F.Ca.ET.067.02.1.1]|uniref:hypothetical protein n=1 Tax=Mesorhizobium sp. M2A.F.Ca.ET.067.02.1.1 TaxID=2496749 RepID=UPI000FD4D8E8|nr:hypothetical protein [Mesorhizobium sp. M2A.F.Ca.ET.067.02.1.1]RUW73683.1 hypothetical protein EOA28_18305 [Mesorhizobium sp. M2A.F.Ca.ET.067.02.1.1]
MPGLVDFDFLLFEQSSYAVYGEAVTLTLDDTAGSTVALDLIDETAGVEVLDHASIATVLPAAAVRAAQLADRSVSAADLHGAALTLNGKSWTVNRHSYRPTPNGEAQGEILLLLEEPDGA